MGAVEDRLSLDRDTEVKPFLGIDPADTSIDWFLDILIAAALHAADDYLNNPFEDEDGTELPIPDDVKLGVMFYIQASYLDQPMRGDPADGEEGCGLCLPPGVTQLKAGDVQISLSVTLLQENPRILRYWRNHRLEPGF